jgi:hypothetical protein
MKLLVNDIVIACMIILILIITGCVETEGCMDKNADNYNEKAVKSDNSCTYRYPTAVKIIAIPLADLEGNQWDVLDGPDIYIRFTSETSNDWLYETETVNNSDGKVTLKISKAGNYFTNENWKYEVLDRDALEEDDLILYGKFNPVVSGGEGRITVSDGPSAIEFQYSLKQ